VAQAAPVAPASFWSDPTEGVPIFDVHRAQSESGLFFTFETFSTDVSSVPREGDTLYLQSHWLPSAMQAALDTSATWKYSAYPDNGEHAHCEFTWETISSYSVVKAGYYSEKYGWITERAYFDFIVNDIYRLRTSLDA